jgi:NAD dependent epimerase/dehydratase family enzyme
MFIPFHLGLGSIIGSGRQYMIALFAAVLAGPVNVGAPDAVTNREFTNTLGRVLYRRTIFSMPAFAARLRRDR